MKKPTKRQAELAESTVSFLNRMKRILLFVGLFCWREDIYSQIISLGNSEINIEINYSTKFKDSLLIIIKNLTQKTAFIDMTDGVGTNGKYLGIGLYSSVFPYFPDGLSKYNGGLRLTAISSSDSLVIKQKARIKPCQDLVFSLDYIILDLAAEKDFAIIDRAVYDKNICFLKLKINM